MSLYSVYSPVSNGEIVLAALEVINRIHNYFTEPENREDAHIVLQRARYILEFRRDDKNPERCLNPHLQEKISATLKRLEQTFGAPWRSDEERINRVNSFWLFRNIIQAQTEASQYSSQAEVLVGQPFLLSEEKFLVGELLTGDIDDKALVSRINSDIGPEKFLSPYRTDADIFGACRNFQKGLAIVNLDDPLEGLRLAVRSFIIFIPTTYLWWKKAIVEFIFDGGVKENFIRARETDFAVEFLLEELYRQRDISEAIGKFKMDTNNAFADLLNFEWLNSPCEQATECQISFGLERKQKVWWATYRKK